MTSEYPFYDPYAGYPPPPAPAPTKARRRRGVVLGAGIAAAVVAGGLIGGAIVAGTDSTTVAGSGSTSQLLPTNPQVPGNLIPGNPNSGTVNPGGGTSTSIGLATASQKKGIVTILSVLRYQNAESAGTGMILTSDGEVLTNNHVVNGATSITVTVASTGKSYRAQVVGTDPSDDVAVLQLSNASGLATANIGDSNVSVGDQVVGVGNAGGTGTLRASHGTVTGLNRSITATDENGQDAERLTGLIQVNAPIVSGDSGGPLYNASGEIVGMDTAAASTNGLVAQTAYAIPIDSAVKIANQIESGVQTAKIHIGLPPFLGVGLDPQITSHAVVGSTLPGGPAAGAGITRGSTITAVDGKQVTTASSLRTLLREHKPGDKVSVTWTDLAGASHTATVTLATGPAD
jgi:S1-C subfamily serine protease